MVPARITLVTLGVADVARSCTFYRSLGWETAIDMDEFAVFRTAPDNPWAGIPALVLSEHGHLPPPTPGIPGILSLGDRAHLESLVAQAGFASSSLESVAMSWRFPDLDTYWRWLVDLTALGPTLRGLSAADASVVRADIDDRAKPFHEGEELALPGLCWCGLATR